MTLTYYERGKLQGKLEGELTALREMVESQLVAKFKVLPILPSSAWKP